MRHKACAAQLTHCVKRTLMTNCDALFSGTTQPLINLSLHKIPGSHNIKEERAAAARAPACCSTLHDREILQVAVLNSYQAWPPTRLGEPFMNKVRTWGMVQEASWRPSTYIRASFYTDRSWNLEKEKKKKKSPLPDALLDFSCLKRGSQKLCLQLHVSLLFFVTS